jgi:hypothetical protein
MATDVLSRGEVDRRIHEKVVADPAFREALKADPRQALQSLLGMEIPEDVRIHVHEESPSSVHLVLPSDAAVSGQAASDGPCWTNCPSDMGP